MANLSLRSVGNAPRFPALPGHAAPKNNVYNSKQSSKKNQVDSCLRRIIAESAPAPIAELAPFQKRIEILLIFSRDHGSLSWCGIRSRHGLACLLSHAGAAIPCRLAGLGHHGMGA
jgi:hypothetical protein